MRADLRLIACTVILGTPLSAQDTPDSAISWLSDSLSTPRTAPRRDEPAATPLTGTQVTVMPLGQTRRDAVGLLSSRLTGLPSDTFAGVDPRRVADLIANLPPDALPAMQDLVLMLMLAELDPPRAAADPDTLFFARVDGLLRFGALDQAQALLERAGATDPQAFRRWWDTSLLTGFDTRACDAMTANPGVAPTLPARIFCLTRSGDWAAAALTLDTGRALGIISKQEDALLAQFLDPEMFENLPPPMAPRPITPLAFRLLDGIGETPSTAGLPLAFAVADLRPTTGWKSQIEAAERLTRARALDVNRLLALYTEGRPSASGGVWDRAAAIQKLDTALIAGDMAGVADALPQAFTRMQDAGLLVPFADLYGERLSHIALDAPAAALALRVGLLSPAYETIAASATATMPRDAFALAIAQGNFDVPPPPDPLSQAINDGLTGTPPDHLTRLAESERLGEALLEAVSLLADGADSDPQDIADALAFFRSVGLLDVARRMALQLLLT
ncbi:hypothetical protein SAMN05444004_11096 [Jannaschia faecimaris]|uniref:Uncharacterized protein n=1 Tax=Jannaschia faecimaris TaxID=1244108 RepID=A0A1H3S3W7_9RHOB|nr:hypothetical protein [Jannaschia faecimaris]SDZ32275.1 hypothetical protein SAMN05444004_11096 [Jannaschia faecimaris]